MKGKGEREEVEEKEEESEEEERGDEEENVEKTRYGRRMGRAQ